MHTHRSRMTLFGTWILLGMAAYGIAFSPQCPRDASWTYIMEYFDQPSVDDIPNSEDAVVAGFSNSNAFFIGEDELDKLNFSEMEVCYTGSTDCRVECLPVDATADLQCVCSRASSQKTSQKQFAIAFAGGCDSECSGTSNYMAKWLDTDRWADSASFALFATYSGVNWHVWYNGATLAINGYTGHGYENSVEVFWLDGRLTAKRVAAGKVAYLDIIQIRVRLPIAATSSVTSTTPTTVTSTSSSTTSTATTSSVTATTSSVTSTSSTTHLIWVSIASRPKFVEIAVVFSVMAIWLASLHS